MKKRGFTLVEIMAAIVILGLIVLVTYPLISKIMVTNKRNLYNEQIHSLEDLARRWAVNNDLLLPNEKASVVLPYVKGSIIYSFCNKHGLWSKEVE